MMKQAGEVRTKGGNIRIEAGTNGMYRVALWIRFTETHIDLTLDQIESLHDTIKDVIEYGTFEDDECLYTLTKDSELKTS